MGRIPLLHRYPPLSTLFNHLYSFSEVTHNFNQLLDDAATSAVSFGDTNRSAKAWWSPEIAEVVAKRRKAFARAHCSEKSRQNYISISMYIWTESRK